LSETCIDTGIEHVLRNKKSTQNRKKRVYSYMPAIFRTDSGVFGDIQASNMVVTGEVRVGSNQTTINEYISNEVVNIVGVDYSAEINTLSGNIDAVSGELNSLSDIVGGLEAGQGTDYSQEIGGLSGQISGVSGYATGLSGVLNDATGVITGHINTLSGIITGATGKNQETYNYATGLSGVLNDATGVITGHINTLSGIITGATGKNQETYNYATGLSGVLNDATGVITGHIDSLSGQITGITGDVGEISGFLKDLDTSAHYSNTDVANYLNGSLDTHIIPIQNSTYDIGSAEYKIRHLYLSSNSLYIGGQEGETGIQISATPEGGIAMPSQLNVSGINISGAIGGVPPTAENDSIQWNTGTKKWESSNSLHTATGDLYTFYKSEAKNITSVSANLTGLNLQPTNVPTSGTAPGAKGDITYDENFVYICVDTNKWRRLSAPHFTGAF